MSRLTDKELDGLQRFVNGDDGPRPIHIVWTDRALAELRERRASDLTSYDRKWLGYARDMLRESIRGCVQSAEYVNACNAVIDRLLARANGGGK